MQNITEIIEISLKKKGDIILIPVIDKLKVLKKNKKISDLVLDPLFSSTNTTFNTYSCKQLSVDLFDLGQDGRRIGSLEEHILILLINDNNYLKARYGMSKKSKKKIAVKLTFIVINTYVW